MRETARKNTNKEKVAAATWMGGESAQETRLYEESERKGRGVEPLAVGQMLDEGLVRL